MKYPAMLLFALVLALNPVSATAEDSRYPGKKPLIVGKYAKSAGHNFAWMEGCGYNYDYKGYKKKLKSLSKADWKHFIRSGSHMRSFDGSGGCRKESFEKVERHLEIYLEELEQRSKQCQNATDCSIAGYVWE